MRFLGKPIAFPRVTRNAGANDIFPCGRPTAIARDDVIQVQFIAFENIPAVLTRVFVALENVMTRELHLFFWQPVEEQQDDDARDTNLPQDGRNHFVIGRRGREVPPAFEIMRQKIIVSVGPDNMGVSGINQGKGAASRANVHGLPKAIQNQNLAV